MKIKLETFQGIRPRQEARLLGRYQAQSAQNVDLLSGILGAIKEPSLAHTLSQAGVLNVFPYNGDWLEWTTDRDVVTNAIIDDQFNRIYYTTPDDVPKIRGVRVRANSTAYTAGQKARWATGNTVWSVTSAGTSAATAPSITGKVVGDTVTDGTVIWTMTSLTLVDADELEYDLGIPKPTNTPSVATAAKLTVDWVRRGPNATDGTWGYQYEESDNSISQSGELTEGGGATNVVEVTAGKKWTVTTAPTKTTATATATLVIWFDAYDSSGTYLGRIYPDISMNFNSTSFYLDGAKGVGRQTNASGPDVTFEIEYDTSRSSEYELDRSYVYCFVSGFGEEGSPSEPSALVPIDPTQNATVSNFDTSVTGNYNIVTVRIYRTVTSAGGTFYYFVADIDLGTATYLDEIADVDTGELIPSIGTDSLGNITTGSRWSAPPSTMQGIVAMPEGWLAGFVDKTVYLTPPNQPHAWPLAYAKTVKNTIVGLAANRSNLVVLTTGIPQVLVGHSPDSVIIEDVDFPQACSSKRSIAVWGDDEATTPSVLYASPDGICSIVGTTGVRISNQMYLRDQWEDLGPTTMIGAVHDGKYYCFNDNINLIFDPENQQTLLTTTDESVSGLYTDVSIDALYLIQSQSLNEWRGGTANKTITWKSKEFQLTRPGRWVVARLLANSYPQTMKVYAEGAEVLSIEMTDDQARKIPKLRKEKNWAVGCVADDDVLELLLSTSMVDL